MSTDNETRDDKADSKEQQQNTRNERRQPPRSIFAIPAPIKQLFDKFPLLSYPANELPQRAPGFRNENVLYIWTTEDAAINRAPSYNPQCLKWQTYLKFSNIRFRLRASNNHASPSGSLPFLLPSSKDTAKPVQPVPGGKLQKWCLQTSSKPVEESGDLRYEAYLSLLDHRIRRAWLYSIYLSENSTSIAEPLYILSASSNPFVRLTIAHELRQAAEQELLKHSAVINEEVLYAEAEEAFSALEMLLGKDEWFFNNTKPGLFDASVFAYTHLMLDNKLGRGWANTSLRDFVTQKPGLVRHRNRILESYFSSP